MSINYEAVRNKFLSVAREAVGSLLSLTGPSNNIPSVIRRRANGVTPPYPYVDFDIIDTTDEHGWETHEYVDNNNNPSSEVNKILLMSYRVYGGDALDISNKLHSHFRKSVIRDDIRTITSGAIVNVYDIDSSPYLLVDKFIESAQFNLTFSITDNTVDTTTGIIDNIHLTGEIYRGDGDPSPIPVVIDAP